MNHQCTGRPKRSTSPRRRAWLIAIGISLVTSLTPMSELGAAPPPPIVRDTGRFACPPGEVPADGFLDTGGNVFLRDISCLAWHDITAGGPEGLPADHYGPRRPVRRDQMASFIARALDRVEPDLLGPDDGAGGRFGDVEGNVHASAIERLADAGVVAGGPAGLPPDSFGPSLVVTREQMASFVDRAYGLVTGGGGLRSSTDFFDDDNRSTHEVSINGLAGAGIIQGRSPGIYAPTAAVRRDAMSSFLVRLLDMLIEWGDTWPRSDYGGPATTTPPPTPTTTTTAAATVPVLTTEIARLTGSDDQGLGEVAISGDTIVVGTGDVNGSDGDGARVFVASGGTWTEQSQLVASDTLPGDDLGGTVAVSGDTTVLGARDDDVGSNLDQGSARVFVRRGTIWSEQATLTAPDGGVADNFGAVVAVDADTAVIASPYFSAPGVRSAHVFVRDGTSWTHQTELLVADDASERTGGISAAISGDTVIVGTPNDGNARGSVHVYVRVGTSWTKQGTLTVPGAASLDFSALSVAVWGDTLVVGSPRLFFPGGGSAHVFVRSGTTWSVQATLDDPDPNDDDIFGVSVAIDGATAVVGSLIVPTAPHEERGAAHVFVREGAVWTEDKELVASADPEGEVFGASVAVDGGTAVVGAPGLTAAGSSPPGSPDDGAAYVFGV